MAGTTLASVSLPEGATATAVGGLGKSSQPRAAAMDARGHWYFADLDGPDRKLVIRTLQPPTTSAEPGQPGVFAEHLGDWTGAPSGGLLVHDGVVYLACLPKLLMLGDADGDGQAEQMKVIQEGFGVSATRSDHGFGGLTLGPDGRVYGTIGDAGVETTTKNGVAYHLPDCGAAFRFELNGSGFEIFHTGLRKPGNIAFDEEGNAFVTDTHPDGAGRVVYLTDGGDSGWRSGASSARLPSANTAPTTAHEPTFYQAAAGPLDFQPSGLVSHPGVGFLDTGVGRFFAGGTSTRTGEAGVWSFAVKTDGAGKVIHDLRREITGISSHSLEFSPDARLWLHNGSDGNLSVISTESGARKPDEAAGSARLLGAGFHQRSPAELLNLLRHPDARVRLASQLALTRKKEAGDTFVEATLSSNPLVRQHGIRGLGILARCGPLPDPFDTFAAVPSGDQLSKALKTLANLTEDRSQTIRCEALRAIANARDESGDVNLGNLLADESPRVRYFATLAVAGRKSAGFFGDLCDMLDRNANQDPWLRQAGAYALQQMSPDSSLLTALATHDSPAVRAAAVIGLFRLGSQDVTAFLEDADANVALEAARAAHALGIGPAPDQDQAAPASAADPAADDHPVQPSSNPWLYIVIGLLLVTGVLLYIDPRIF